jgi:hypothetical protein
LNANVPEIKKNNQQKYRPFFLTAPVGEDQRVSVSVLTNGRDLNFEGWQRPALKWNSSELHFNGPLVKKN